MNVIKAGGEVLGGCQQDDCLVAHIGRGWASASVSKMQLIITLLFDYSERWETAHVEERCS